MKRQVKDPRVFVDEMWFCSECIFTIQMKRVTTNESRRNKPVVVAALDTGIYTAHPYLQQSVVESKNFVSDRPDRELQNHIPFGSKRQILAFDLNAAIVWERHAFNFLGQEGF